MKLSVNNVEFTVRDQKIPYIHVYGRDELLKSKHIVVKGYRPYFWASEKSLDKLPKENVNGEPIENYEISDETGISIHKEPLRKIYVDTPYNVKKFAEYVENYEADVSYPIRFMIDLDIKTGIEVPDGKTVVDVEDVHACDFAVDPRVWMVDIECLDDNGFPKPERDPITCITVYDSYTDHYTTYYTLANVNLFEDAEPLENGCFNHEKHTICVDVDERNMLSKFMSNMKLEDPDVLSGWNFKEFDIDYIIRRLEQLDMHPEEIGRLPAKIDKDHVKGRTIFDLLEGYKKLHPTKLESYRLDYVGEIEVGENKVEYTGTLGNLWRNDVKHMIEYNYQDVQLCVKLNDKGSIISFFTEIARYIGCPLANTLHSSQVVDVYVLNTAKGKYVLPTRGSAEEGETFEGATVFKPKKGLKKMIGVVDLKALYPMSMITCNASIETKVTDPSVPDELCNIAPTGTRFLKEPDGITRTIINTLLKERDAKKELRNTYPFDSPEYEKLDMQQNVVKVIMNTYYGVSGFARFRLYDRDIGAAVTSIGRATIAHTKEYIAKKGYDVIYGDTDSCFIQMPPENTLEQNVELGLQLAKELNASYPVYAKEKLNSDTCFFSIKFEKLYSNFFQGDAKKRYAGIILWKEGVLVNDGNGELSISGFELKRSDSSKITQQVQEYVFTHILEGCTKEDLQDYIKGIVKDFRSGNLPLEMIGVPNALSREIEEYDGNRMQVRAAKWSNDNLGTNFRSGSKPKRIFVKWVHPKYAPTDVVAFEHAYDIDIENEFKPDYILMCEKEIKQPIERILDCLGWKWDDFDPDIIPQSSLDDWF